MVLIKSCEKTTSTAVRRPRECSPSTCSPLEAVDEMIRERGNYRFQRAFNEAWRPLSNSRRAPEEIEAIVRTYRDIVGIPQAGG